MVPSRLRQPQRDPKLTLKSLTLFSEERSRTIHRDLLFLFSMERGASKGQICEKSRSIKADEAMAATREAQQSIDFDLSWLTPQLPTLIQELTLPEPDALSTGSEFTSRRGSAAHLLQQLCFGLWHAKGAFIAAPGPIGFTKAESAILTFPAFSKTPILKPHGVTDTTSLEILNAMAEKEEYDVSDPLFPTRFPGEETKSGSRLLFAREMLTGGPKMAERRKNCIDKICVAVFAAGGLPSLLELLLRGSMQNKLAAAKLLFFMFESSFLQAQALAMEVNLLPILVMFARLDVHSAASIKLTMLRLLRQLACNAVNHTRFLEIGILDPLRLELSPSDMYCPERNDWIQKMIFAACHINPPALPTRLSSSSGSPSGLPSNAVRKKGKSKKKTKKKKFTVKEVAMKEGGKLCLWSLKSFSSSASDLFGPPEEASASENSAETPSLEDAASKGDTDKKGRGSKSPKTAVSDDLQRSRRVHKDVKEKEIKFEAKLTTAERKSSVSVMHPDDAIHLVGRWLRYRVKMDTEILLTFCGLGLTPSQACLTAVLKTVAWSLNIVGSATVKCNCEKDPEPSEWLNFPDYRCSVLAFQCPLLFCTNTHVGVLPKRQHLFHELVRIEEMKLLLIAALNVIILGLSDPRCSSHMRKDPHADLAMKRLAQACASLENRHRFVCVARETRRSSQTRRSVSPTPATHSSADQAASSQDAFFPHADLSCAVARWQLAMAGRWTVASVPGYQVIMHTPIMNHRILQAESKTREVMQMSRTKTRKTADDGSPQAVNADLLYAYLDNFSHMSELKEAHSGVFMLCCRLACPNFASLSEAARNRRANFCICRTAPLGTAPIAAPSTHFVTDTLPESLCQTVVASCSPTCLREAKEEEKVGEEKKSGAFFSDTSPVPLSALASRTALDPSTLPPKIPSSAPCLCGVVYCSDTCQALDLAYHVQFCKLSS